MLGSLGRQQHGEHNDEESTYHSLGYCRMRCIGLSLGICVDPAFAHHSFAMYDQTKMLVLTGVAHQFIAQANHAELHFYLIGPDGKLEKDQRRAADRLGRGDGGRCSCGEARHYGGVVRRGHDIHCTYESAPKRRQFWIPGRPHLQMPLENASRPR